mgnify:CR=1 FL=1
MLDDAGLSEKAEQGGEVETDDDDDFGSLLDDLKLPSEGEVDIDLNEK